MGEESKETAGEAPPRFSARWTGRKMPAPATVVLKYCTLASVLALTLRHVSVSDTPVDVAIILPARRKTPVQLDADESTVLAAHAAHELDHAVHVARHVDRVADLEIALHAGARGCFGIVALSGQCAVAGFPCRARAEVGGDGRSADATLSRCLQRHAREWK